MSKKDIAFLFYPNDWLGGTQGFTFEQKGAYMELLLFQFNNGPMSIEDIKDVLGPYFEKLWERKLKGKFLFQDDKYFNRRIAEAKSKREKYSESRRNNFNGGNKPKHEEEVQAEQTTVHKPKNLIDQYFNDLRNSEQFHDISRRLQMDPEYLASFIPAFKLKAELEYPYFARFANHFKNYVLKELKDGQSNSKSKHAGTYNAEALSQLNSAIKKS